MSRGIKIKGTEHIYKNIVLTFWYEKKIKIANLKTGFYFRKYYFLLINWKENMLNINVFLVGTKESNVTLTNPFFNPLK